MKEGGRAYSYVEILDDIFCLRKLQLKTYEGKIEKKIVLNSGIMTVGHDDNSIRNFFQSKLELYE